MCISQHRRISLSIGTQTSKRRNHGDGCLPWVAARVSAVGSKAYGQTLTFCSQTQWLSCGICSKWFAFLYVLMQVKSGDPTCNHVSRSYKTRLQRTRDVRFPGKSPEGDTTSVILDSWKTLVASCTSTQRVSATFQSVQQCQVNCASTHSQSPNSSIRTLRTYRRDDTFKRGRA